MHKTTIFDAFIRFAFERLVLSRWSGRGIRVRYWDGRETNVGISPYNTTLIFHRPSALRNTLLLRSLGFGNAYARKHIEIAGDLAQFLRDVFKQSQAMNNIWLPEIGQAIVALRGHGSPYRAKENARFHYDTGNQFFSGWLDGSMTYSCAYFRTRQDDLSTAQRQKHELLCRKLELAPGQSLLDVGCGWGALMFHAVEQYGVNAVGVTPSRQQADFIYKKAAERGLTGRISVIVSDWRNINEQFDRVVSVGMFEHVGIAHGRRFFERWKRWLADDGVSVLHTIGAMDSKAPDPWIDKHIFPGGYLPSLSELTNHARNTELVVTDIENLWRHYTLTLSAWIKRYEAVRKDTVEHKGVEFDRTWWLYLNASRAAFETGRLCLWQMVLTKGKRENQPLTREQWSLTQPTGHENDTQGPPERAMPISAPYYR